MILCGEYCEPCCDFCIHCIHEEKMEDGEVSHGAPIGCGKHKDQEHQDIALICGYCDDFHCFRAE